MSRIRRSFVLLCLAAVTISAPVQPARAHPLGNNSITHFSVLYVLPDRVEIDFYLDIAEDPTRYIEMTEMDDDGDSRVTREEQETWLEEKAVEYLEQVHLKIGGRPIPVELVPEERDPKTNRKTVTSKIILPVLGPMGMTYRVVIRYFARYPQPLGPGTHHLEYEDRTYLQQTGLKRILLEQTSRIGTLDSALKADLTDGPVPASLRQALAGYGLMLTDEDAAAVARVSPDDAGNARWLIRDAGRVSLLVAEPKGLGLYRTPVIEILPPHPVFWSAEDDPFRYEQYDPANLPDERKASFQFRIHPVPEVVSAPGAPAMATATEPAGVGATKVATATRPAGPEEATVAATQPAAPMSEAARTARTSEFLDPAKNPILTSKYQRQSERLMALLRGEWGVVMFLTVTFLSFGWGAAHALMPGHAKTVVAAYLISQRGTYWHAVMLAVIVTITHTALVVVMGLIIYYYKETDPSLGPRLQLWLGMIAGLLVAAMGLTLIWRALRGGIGHHHHDHHHHDHGHDDRSWLRKLFTHSHPHLPAHAHAHEHAQDHSHDHGHVHAHDHSHDHGHVHEHDHGHPHTDGHDHPHDHAHEHTHEPHSHDHEARRAEEQAAGRMPAPHGHEHSHGHHSHGPAADEPLSFRTLLILGVTGGIVPCPTATIIMLLGIGANVVLGALYAVGVFSLGLALTLMAVGSLALFSRRFAAKVMSDAEHEGELTGTGRRVLLQYIPALSGLAVIALGGAISAHYLYLMRTGQGLFAWMG